ncbi:hypothetical protein HY605_03500, partial [Candidatus Peregrinibacteria bacterium]|nr:hypothetical protein [Candidatus Peregrinibacteria bacterium]
ALAILLVVGLITATTPKTNLGGYVDSFETRKQCDDGISVEADESCPEEEDIDPFFNSVLHLIDVTAENLK